MRRNQPCEKQREQQLRRLQKGGQCGAKILMERVEDRGAEAKFGRVGKAMKVF